MTTQAMRCTLAKLQGKAAASIPRSAVLVPLQKISRFHDFQTVETHPHQGTEITLVQGQKHIGKRQRREKNRPIFCRREDHWPIHHKLVSH